MLWQARPEGHGTGKFQKRNFSYRRAKLFVPAASLPGTRNANSVSPYQTRQQASLANEQNMTKYIFGFLYARAFL
jgi:hypothetical protein